MWCGKYLKKREIGKIERFRGGLEYEDSKDKYWKITYRSDKYRNGLRISVASKVDFSTLVHNT